MTLGLSVNVYLSAYICVLHLLINFDLTQKLFVCQINSLSSYDHNNFNPTFFQFTCLFDRYKREGGHSFAYLSSSSVAASIGAKEFTCCCSQLCSRSMLLLEVYFLDNHKFVLFKVNRYNYSRCVKCILWTTEFERKRYWLPPLTGYFWSKLSWLWLPSVV